MKPVMSRATLQVALVLVGGVLVAISEVPGIAPLWAKIIQAAGVAIGSSQLIRRLTDYAPDEVIVADPRKPE